MFNPAFPPLGLPRTVYAERSRSFDSGVERACARLVGPAARLFRLHGLAGRRFVEAVTAHGVSLQKLNHERRQEYIKDLKQHLQQRNWSAARAAQSFAVIREVAAQVLGMRHFDVQVLGVGFYSMA